MSGLQIFNAFPHLHWGSKAEPEEALLSISAINQNGDGRGYVELFGYRILNTTVETPPVEISNRTSGEQGQEAERDVEK